MQKICENKRHSKEAGSEGKEACLEANKAVKIASAVFLQSESKKLFSFANAVEQNSFYYIIDYSCEVTRD